MTYGHIGCYVHPDGKTAALVELGTDDSFTCRTSEVKELTHSLAMQVAALKPLAISEEDIPPEVLEKEEYYRERKIAHLPESQRMEARRKAIEEFERDTVLLKQPFIRDNSKLVGDVLREMSTQLSTPITIRRFVCYVTV